MNLVTRFNDDITSGEFFTDERLLALNESGQLPSGTVWGVLEDQGVAFVQLPSDYCPDCPPVVIINGTEDAEYEIEGDLIDPFPVGVKSEH